MSQAIKRATKSVRSMPTAPAWKVATSRAYAGCYPNPGCDRSNKATRSLVLCDARCITVASTWKLTFCFQKKKWSQSLLANAMHTIEFVPCRFQMNNRRFPPISIAILRSKGKVAWLDISVDAVKSREVRQIFRHMNLTTLDLIRVEFGPYELGDLPSGCAKERRIWSWMNFQWLLWNQLQNPLSCSC